jgi:hypothetical protein
VKEDNSKIEMRANLRCQIELPEEHAVDLLIFWNTFYVNRNPVRRMPFGIVEISGT